MAHFNRRRSSNRRAALPFRPRFELLELRQMLSAADLTDWSGVGNESTPNDYGAISASSVGGTIDDRRNGAGEAAAYFADTSLALDVEGGVLSADTPGGFEASGTLTFDASTDNTSVADPVFHLGFFDKDDLTAGAFGLTLANSTTTAFRFRAIADLTQTSGSGTAVSQGTYTFDLDVNNADSGADKVRIRLVNSSQVTVLDVNVSIPVGSTLQADSFGFLQPLASSAADTTFSLTLSDVNYTGESLVPAAPTNLSATATTGQIDLTWTDNADNESSYAIERSIGTNGSFTQIATVNAGVTNYTNIGLDASTTYYYRVRALNGALASSYSNEANATTPAASGVADLSGFTGSGNTSAPNNYTASTTSAGGTFDARRNGAGEAAAYLADTSLAVPGGVLTASTAGGFGAVGTLTFDASTDDVSLADPVFNIGFFDNDDLTAGAFGFTIADFSTSAFRFRSSAGTAQTAGSGTVVGEGTYTFDLDVNNAESGADKVRFRLIDAASATVLDVSVDIPANSTLEADSFGFLQPLASSDSDATFGLTLSDVNYTGETLVAVTPDVADLSGFAGSGNTSAPNNYTASSTSSGGTFDDRRNGAGEAAAYLADTALAVPGGVLTAADSFEASGTLTFDSSTDNTSIADPIFHLGFFDKDDLTAGAFGLTLANSTTTAFRFRAIADLTQTSGSGTVVSQGTYTFDLDVNNADSGADTVRIRLVDSSQVTVLDVSVAISGSSTLQADSFGFLQPLAGSDSDATFSLTLSDINYTGETQVGGTPATPAAPTGLNATATTGQIDLSWTDNANNETGYAIERSIGTNGSFTQIATVGAGVTSYADGGLAASTTYYYRVRAFNAGGSSGYSNEDSATTPSAASAPAAPTSLNATASAGQVSLAWTDNATNETGFAIERRIGTTGSFSQIATVGANATSYVDTGLAASTTYYYRVRAFNGSLFSAYSNEDSATTPVASSTYYIAPGGSDSNSGTSVGAAWATLDKALRTAPANSIVYLREGSYGDQTTTTNPNRTGKVTFTPYQDELVTVTGTIDWRYVTDVRLEGIKFTGFVQVTDTERFEFVNNEMAAGQLVIYGIDGGLIEGNNFHGYTTSGTAILLRSYNIFLFPGSQKRDFTAANVVIRGNTIDMNNQPGDGIHVEVAENILIEKNDIKNVRTTTAVHGDSMQLVEVSNSTITGNIMGPGRGIIVHHFRNGDGSAYQPYIPGVNHDLTFTNNVHSGSSFSLTVSEAPRLTVVNNTFWGSSTSEGAGLSLGGGVTDAVVVNNILRAMTVRSTVTFAARGNNLIDVLYNLSGYPDLFTGEVNVAATFVNSFVNYAARDLRLKAGSQGIDDGGDNGDLVDADTDGDGDIDGTVAVSDVPQFDFNGLSRVAPTDIGAYEFH